MLKNQQLTLGELIKAALVEKGLNQSAVAKKMNVTKQVINQIDRRKNFDMEFLQKLKAATDIDFTNYTGSENANNRVVQSEQEEDVPTSPLIEMSLSIKIKSSTEQINQIGELLMIFRREADRMGFAVS